jgi:hypothetical protein
MILLSYYNIHLNSSSKVTSTRDVDIVNKKNEMDSVKETTAAPESEIQYIPKVALQDCHKPRPDSV